MGLGDGISAALSFPDEKPEPVEKLRAVSRSSLGLEGQDLT